MGSRRNTRRVTGARPGGFILIQRCTTHDRLRFRGPQHHAPQSGTRRVPALRFRGIMKPFSALSSKLKIIRATASAHSSTSSALPSVATKIDQYPYASLRLRSNVVIGNTRAGRVPPPPQPCFARVLPINAKGISGAWCGECPQPARRFLYPYTPIEMRPPHSNSPEYSRSPAGEPAFGPAPAAC
jgi:hypothetical protein